MTDRRTVPTLGVRAADGVATLELNRPTSLNALTEQLGEELTSALSTIAGDDRVRVVVLTGAGAAFSAGADLHELDPKKLGERMSGSNAIVTALRELPQPVIAKVRGAAVGAGCNLALACDFVVADETARFCQIFARIGLSPDLGGTWLLPRLVGLRQARELALLGEEIDGPTAQRCGLISSCVPAAELDAAVEALAARLSALSPVAQARTKQLLDAAWGATLEESLQAEITAQVANIRTPTFRTALDQFRNRTQGEAT